MKIKLLLWVYWVAATFLLLTTNRTLGQLKIDTASLLPINTYAFTPRLVEVNYQFTPAHRRSYTTIDENHQSFALETNPYHTVHMALVAPLLVKKKGFTVLSSVDYYQFWYNINRIEHNGPTVPVGQVFEAGFFKWTTSAIKFSMIGDFPLMVGGRLSAFGNSPRHIMRWGGLVTVGSPFIRKKHMYLSLGFLYNFNVHWAIARLLPHIIFNTYLTDKITMEVNLPKGGHFRYLFSDNMYGFFGGNVLQVLPFTRVDSNPFILTDDIFEFRNTGWRTYYRQEIRLLGPVWGSLEVGHHWDFASRFMEPNLPNKQSWNRADVHHLYGLAGVFLRIVK